MQRDATFVVVCGCAALFATTTFIRAVPLHTVSIGADGRDELRISGGSMVVEHGSWALPNTLKVDGVLQTMVFNGNTSNPIPVPMSGDYWVKKTLGRDGAYAVQRSDGYALAAVDNPNGADFYQFDLYAAPQENTTDWMHVIGAGAAPGHMKFPGTPGYAQQPLGTETTFSLNVDGTDELIFVGGNLVIRHLSWNNPVSLAINGVPQALSFTNNFSTPIPLALPDDLQFQQLGGRVVLYPVKTPVGLVIGADDELLGADVYTWKITAVPEPASLITVAIVATVIGARRRVALRQGIPAAG
jgi:hypothetical protein